MQHNTICTIGSHSLQALSCDLSAHSVFLNKSCQVDQLVPLLAETGFDCNQNSLCVTRRSRSKMMSARSASLPAWNLLAVLSVGSLNLTCKLCGDVCHLIHLAHVHTVLIPLDLPLRIPVPDIHDNTVRMHCRLAESESLRNVSLAVTYSLVVPCEFTGRLCEDLVALWCAVGAEFGVPPCSADGCQVVVCDVLLYDSIVVDVSVAGHDGHLASTHDIQKSVSLVGLSSAFTDRRMLGDVKVCTCRNICHQSLDPCDHMVGITHLMLVVGLIDDVVQDNDHVLAKEEGIVLRTHDASVKGRALNVTAVPCCIVMVSNYRIERDSGLDDVPLVVVQAGDFIPCDVAESHSDCHSAKRLGCGCQVCKRCTGELCEMLRSACLRIRHCNDVIVLTTLCLLQVEIELAYALRLLVERRHTRSPIRNISGRSHEIYEFCIVLDVERKLSFCVSSCEI